VVKEEFADLVSKQRVPTQQELSLQRLSFEGSLKTLAYGEGTNEINGRGNMGKKKRGQTSQDPIN